jgi:hypothetical protein
MQYYLIIKHELLTLNDSYDNTLINTKTTPTPLISTPHIGIGQDDKGAVLLPLALLEEGRQVPDAPQLRRQAIGKGRSALDDLLLALGLVRLFRIGGDFVALGKKKKPNAKRK